MWGPEGETKRESRVVTRQELEYEAAIKPEFPALFEFVCMIQPDDVVTYEFVGNNHWSFSVYRGKRKNGIEYTCPISVRMS